LLIFGLFEFFLFEHEKGIAIGVALSQICTFVGGAEIGAHDLTELSAVTLAGAICISIWLELAMI